eukprot:TRINITY_DN4068_c0_g1_i1.p1 TRINITY_DN4068_c0_g1~~TRINITY_DN4068_c0_g1_i1.p1  ORF type:complete len:340 (+),score=47.52 TRINITY_DN4068_c0_g1_i1:49-1068(+)
MSSSPSLWSRQKTWLIGGGLIACGLAMAYFLLRKRSYVLHIYRDAKRFQTDILPFLQKNEAQNNLILGFTAKACSDRPEENKKHDFLALVRKGPEVVASVIRLYPFSVLCTSSIANEHLDAASEAIGEGLASIAGKFSDGMTLTTVVGSTQEVDGISNAMVKRLHGWTTQLRMKETVYELNTLKLDKVRKCEGRAVLATGEHKDALVEMSSAFLKEVPVPSRQDVVENVESNIKGKRAFVWEVDNRAVCQVFYSGDTPSGGRIGWVFTKTEYRGKGYGTCLMAHVVKHMLDSGKKSCFLMADDSNLISNHLYQNLGFESRGPFIMRDVLAPSGTSSSHT